MRRFLKQLMDFYIKDFIAIKNQWRKSFSISLVFLFIENVQLLSLICQSIPLSGWNYFNIIHKILNLFRLYSIIGESITVLVIYVILGFLITLIPILLLLYLATLMQSDETLNNQMQQLTLQLEKYKRYETNQNIKLFISIYIQIYHSLIKLPLCYSHFYIMNYYYNIDSQNSLILVGTIISCCSIGIQFLFIFFIEIHNFEFKMKKQDYLGKFNTYNLHFFQCYQLSLIILIGFGIKSIILQVFYSIYLILQITANYRQSLFVEIMISRIQFQISTYFFIYTLTLYLAQYWDTNLNFLGLLIFFLPFIVSILFIMIERQKLQSLKFESNSLEKQIRLLYYLFKKQIRRKKEQRALDPLESLFIYSFITNHLRYCKINRERKAQRQQNIKFNCFCEQYGEEEDFQFDTISKMKHFAKELIAQTLEDEIISTGDSYLNLVYIYFLVQVKKLPTMAIYEVIRLSLISHKLSLKEQAIIFTLKFDALDEFERVVQKNDLKNQKYIFKKVYQYEESLSIIKNNLCIITRQFKDWFNVILTSIIDLDQLVNTGFDILNNIDYVEKQLQLAFKTNPLSNECDTIYNIFQKYIQFNKSRQKLYKIEGKYYTQFLQQMEKVIFDPGSCVIQITLLQPRGNVIRYTRSFQKAIGFKDEEIQDQNIHRFMPQIIADDHDMYLDNFVERGRIIVVRSEVRVILGKNKGQFLVPINTRLRIETGPTEFGATALITPVNLNFGYMMLNEKGQIEEVSQNIFEEMFQKNLGIQIEQIRGIDCLFFVPDVAKIWSDIYKDIDKIDRRIECKFIIPIISGIKSASQSIINTKMLSKSFFQRQIYKQVENEEVEHAIYQVYLHIMSLVTINLKLVIFELQDFRQIQNYKITSKQLIDLKVRTNAQLQLQISYGNNTSSYRDQVSLLNSPHTIDCDLDNNFLQEEERMIDVFKNQLATINLSNTIRQQEKLIQYIDDPDDEMENGFVQNKKNGKLNQDENPSQFSNTKFQDTKPKQQNAQQQQLQYANNQSVGSRSSQNNQSQLRRQFKDSLNDHTSIRKFEMFILFCFYTFISIALIVNSVIIELNFNKIGQNQARLNQPFKLSYFYNEFLISFYYIQYNDVFPFSELQNISLEVYQDEMQYIDDVISIFPQINTLSTITFKQQIVNIISEMVDIINYNETNFSDFTNNTQFFSSIIQDLAAVDQTSNIISLEYIVLSEEIVVAFFIIWYIYKCLLTIKIKTKVYKLFSTFSTDVIQELYITFSTLYSQMNNQKFRKEETDEEQFETTVSLAFRKQGNINLLEKFQKVGKRTKQRRNCYQFSCVTFAFLLLVVVSIYLIGSQVLFNNSIDSILQKYNDKLLFTNAYYQLTLSYAQMNFLIYQNITDTIISIQNNTVTTLSKLRNKVSLFQNDPQVYDILTQATCYIFNYTIQTGNIHYDNMFSQSECLNYSILQKGLSVVFQDLYLQQLTFLQALQQNLSSDYLVNNFNLISTQIERLYVSMGFFVIVSTEIEQIQQTISNNISFSFAMLGMFIVLITIAILFMALQMTQLRHQYQKSKQLLTLLPYERLLENAYVISFIQQDIKFQK